MNSANIAENGTIQRTELCFCPTPLQHERATVYDKFFTAKETVPIAQHELMQGDSFMGKLAKS